MTNSVNDDTIATQFARAAQEDLFEGFDFAKDRGVSDLFEAVRDLVDLDNFLRAAKVVQGGYEITPEKMDNFLSDMVLSGYIDGFKRATSGSDYSPETSQLLDYIGNYVPTDEEDYSEITKEELQTWGFWSQHAGFCAGFSDGRRQKRQNGEGLKAKDAFQAQYAIVRGFTW